MWGIYTIVKNIIVIKRINPQRTTVAKFWPLLFWAAWFKMMMYVDFLKIFM
jgi:hypothetical protein